ncbi:hypothetical protein OG21DRAFT_1420016 [Imleria badia]|nr:hypothetical protein OG21DRAFT_1420016 [Imleria badia]
MRRVRELTCVFIPDTPCDLLVHLGALSCISATAPPHDTTIYLTFHARKSFRAPCHPIPFILTAGATACSTLYGTEYFLY